MTVRRAGLYSLFAVAATVMNFGVQAATLRTWPFAYGVAASVVAGTIAGLGVKYVLDKRFIFRFTTQNLGHDGRLFLLYGIMSIATTVIFWSSEFTVGSMLGGEGARYLGGAIGLAFGYMVKYQLDRRFVFRIPATALVDPA